ncbi:MAG TPA: CPBP family intramembrane glutamic endopeptidase [Nannocystis sp.]
MVHSPQVTPEQAQEPDPAGGPGPAGPGGLAAGVSAATSEILLAVFAFVLAFALLLAIPGVQPAIFWVLDATFGRPLLSPDKVRQVHGIVLTPLATLAAALLYGWLGRRVDGLSAPPPAVWRVAGPAATAGQVVLHVLLAIAGSYVLALLMHLLGAPVSEQRLVLDLVAGGDLRRPELATLALSALVLAPVGEELFFRGQLMRRTWQRGGPVAAYLASALLFAAFHGNLQGFVVYTWLGLVFGLVYARTGRIGAAMVVHFGNNALTLAMLLLTPPAP